MEHEVFVPVPADRLKVVLAEPARVARAVPGLQQEAGAEPVAGRLRLRVAGTTITYRGAVRITARQDGSYAVVGEGTETRGTGTVKLDLTLRPAATDDGTTLAFAGTAAADGRITELTAESVASAVTRLLDRFAENLATEAADDNASREVPEPASVFDTEIPPPSLDREPDEDADTAESAGDADRAAASVTRNFAESAEPPAEAAHARRTMIGRSAEEVDHAPPRGRYAPVPAPQTVVAGGTLRWAAPAAALVVASVIVAGRALRRRR
ncbi:SRPBCC domain-containing protein [Streptomyces sp. NPDC001595]|uniref:SRPBCC domain-containing protein n=1 Tax=Streptomyces sp. NPDC001532 TaxID=3154520 RepID=UPI0033220E01